MKRTVIACITYRGMQPETRRTIDRLRAAGAELVQIDGQCDLALARSTSLTLTLALAKKQGVVDVILVVDDDMAFESAQAEELVATARKYGEVVSGAYATKTGYLAASPSPVRPDRWLTGFGFLAIPVAAMIAVEPRVPVLEANGARVQAWCQSGPHPDNGRTWTIDDAWFCLWWGGVRLAPIGAAHLKTMPIRVDAATLRSIADGSVRELFTRAEHES